MSKPAEIMKTTNATPVNYSYYQNARSSNSQLLQSDGVWNYTRYYTHGQGIDNVMAKDDGTSTNYYYKNHLGSTSVISNGTYTDDYDYTSWGGIVTGSSMPGEGNSTEFILSLSKGSA